MTHVAYVSADPGVPVFGRKGCSIHVQELLRALKKCDTRIDLFAMNSAGTPPAEIADVRLHPLPSPPKGDVALREQQCLAANSTLSDALQREGPFSLVYERYSLWSFAGMEYARAAGVPGLLEVNALLIEEQAEYRVLIDRLSAEKTAERAFGAATTILAVSNEVAGYVERFPSARGKIHVIPNAIRPERFPEVVKPALPAAAGIFTVGFVGTLKAWHGLSVLIEAFDLLHAREAQTRLLIIGDGPERERIGADIAARGLQEASCLTGAVSPEEIPAMLASMDVAVAPYPKLAQFYFSPLKVYEYMAASLPVVASSIGQLETLIQPGVNGVLVPPGDAAKLADALVRLQSEPDTRRRLGRAARAKVMQEHTWDSVAKRILSLAGVERPAQWHQTGSLAAQQD